MKSIFKDKRGKVDLDTGMKMVTKFFISILSLGVLGFALIIVLVNLEGSSGFAEGSLNANNTASMLGNITGGATNFFSNAGTWFTLLSVIIIIAIVVVVIVLVKSTGKTSGSDL